MDNRKFWNALLATLWIPFLWVIAGVGFFSGLIWIALYAGFTYAEKWMESFIKPHA